MNTVDNMVFVALNKHVVALDRDTGEIRWQWIAPKSGSFMTMLPSGDRLIVSAGGYIYCLDPTTGQEIWNNPLKGFGIGVAALATVRQRTADVDIAAAADTIRAAQGAAAMTS